MPEERSHVIETWRNYTIYNNGVPEVFPYGSHGGLSLKLGKERVKTLKERGRTISILVEEVEKWREGTIASRNVGRISVDEFLKLENL